MTNEQINRAIAEACGWTNLELCTCKLTTRGTRPVGSYYGPHIPDYCTDLNAIHEAEEVLTDVQCLFFRTHLRERLENHPASLYVWHATARQRAEAFLRTLGKWEEPVVKDSLTTDGDLLRDATKKVGEKQP